MLIEFSITNYKSVRLKQTLSMVPTHSLKDDETSLIKSDSSVPSLLPTAAIYGANGAGKSNILEALDFMHWFIIRSSARNSDKDIPVESFVFDDNADQPVTFEVIFLSEGVRYQYGFTINTKVVLHEWLFSYPKRERHLFERIMNDNGAYDTHVNNQFLASKTVSDTWINSTRPNALFLSTAIQLNSESLKPVYNWFSRTLMTNQDLDGDITSEKCVESKSFFSKVDKLMQLADVGINAMDINTETKKVSTMAEKIAADSDAPGFLLHFVKGIQSDPDFPQESKIYKVKFNHGKQKNGYQLNLNQESKGTQNFYGLVGPVLDALERGAVLVVDELDSSLHPLLCKHIVGLFHDKDINKLGAQLVFSTHDATLLDRDLMRRDQIWFVEKDRDQQTHLYPLTDFSPRKNESLDRGYLVGRYGAIPFLENFKFD